MVSKMHNDYEDQVLARMNELLDEYTIETLLEQADLTEAEALTKLILEGHIDESQLPSLCK